jgi:FkbM family methyltransferase
MYKKIYEAYGKNDNINIILDVKENFTNSNPIKKCIDNFYRIGTEKFKNENYLQSDEIPERFSIYYLLEPTDKVLEIGGAEGGVSEIIAKKLNNPKNLVVLEPSNESFKKLDELSKKYNFNAFNGPLVNENENIKCDKRPDSSYAACNTVNYKVDNNITFKKLQEKYNIVFDTLVIDCEGCYEIFLEQNFQNGTLKDIKKIFIEWDGKFIENYFIKEGFVLIAMLPHKYLEKGVRVYVR